MPPPAHIGRAQGRMHPSELPQMDPSLGNIEKASIELARVALRAPGVSSRPQTGSLRPVELR
jgi:hypothetical protein